MALNKINNIKIRYIVDKIKSENKQILSKDIAIHVLKNILCSLDTEKRLKVEVPSTQVVYGFK